MTDVDATRLLAEHARGDSLRSIGARHHVSHEHVRRIVSARGSQLIDQLVSDLVEGERLERQGREAQWPTYLLPFQAQSDWQDALAMFDWTVKQLRGRGFDIEVVTATTPAGMALMLTVPQRPGRPNIEEEENPS